MFFLALHSVAFVPEHLKLTPFYTDKFPVFMDNNKLWTVVGTAVKNRTSK